MTHWSLEAAWGSSKGVPPSGGPSRPAWKVVRTAGQEAIARMGTHKLDVEVFLFFKF